MLATVAGPNGSGKSTVLRALEDVGFQVVQRKTSRSILAEWGVTLSQVNNDRDLTVKFQWEILRRKAADELAAVQSDRLIFTERSFADLCTYANIAIAKDNEFSEFVDAYYNECKTAQKAYTHVFYLQATPTVIENDGVRAINRHYNDMVNMVMLDYTRKWTAASKFTAVSSLDRVERIEIITGIARNLK